MIRSTLLAVGLFAHLSAAETLLVPEQYVDVSDAINSSSADDLILVDSSHIDGGGWSLPHKLTITGNSTKEKFVVQTTNDLFVNSSDHEVHLENIEFQLDAAIGAVTQVSIANCVIDGSNTQVSFIDPQADNPTFVIANSVFKNFGNEFNQSTGGVIFMGDVSNFTLSVSNCLFEDCRSSYGAAITVFSSGGTLNVSECQFTDCVANSRGGAISLQLTEGLPSISNCGFTECSAGSGGAIYVYNGSSPEITNCTFTENTAVSDAGGAIWAAPYPMTIAGCEFIRNVATGYGGGLYHDGPSNLVFASGCNFEQNTGSIGGGVSGPITIDLCSFCENTPSAIGPDVVVGNSNTFDESCGSCCIGGGCIPSSQQVCTDSGGTFVTAGCIDAGCASPFGSCCNQGSCIESTLESCFEAGGSFAGFGTSCTDIECPTVCEGDVSGNGNIDFTDLLILISNWGNCPG